MVSHQP